VEEIFTLFRKLGLGFDRDSQTLFRCESATLRAHWVLVIMDQYTRRIIGFGASRPVVMGENPSNHVFVDLDVERQGDLLGGKTNRHPSTRVFRSHVVLDDCRSRKQTARFQDLLQPPSHAYLTGRANAGSARVTTCSQSPLVSMATPLSGPLSDTGGRLICQRLALAAVNLGKTSKKSLGVSPSQRASRVRSFHRHRMRPESETQPTFAASQRDYL